MQPRLMPTLFWAALVFSLVMACLPHPPQVPLDPSDKIQHMLAFAVLTILAVIAWPSTPWWKLLWRLSAFGAFIEVVQLIPVLHRDSDWHDWVADTIACGVMLAAAGLVRPWFRLTR